MDDPDAIREWPDAADREEGLRESWDEQADYAAYRRTHADADVEVLRGYRDELSSLRGEPESLQADYYRRIGELGGVALAVAANDNVPGGGPPGGPDDRPPKSDYERELAAAAARGPKDPERGRGR